MNKKQKYFHYLKIGNEKTSVNFFTNAQDFELECSKSLPFQEGVFVKNNGKNLDRVNILEVYSDHEIGDFDKIRFPYVDVLSHLR